MIADNRPTQKLLYEGLVKYVDGEIQPVLAEDWEMSEDGKQLTFYLRQGVLSKCVERLRNSPEYHLSVGGRRAV